MIKSKHVKWIKRNKKEILHTNPLKTEKFTEIERIDVHDCHFNNPNYLQVMQNESNNYTGKVIK